MPTSSEMIDLAVRHHKNGELSQAEALYHQVLKVEPRHARALHLLGLLAHQTGRHAMALALIRQAIATDPGDAAYHMNLGVILKDLGQTAEATVCYRQSLQLNPHSVETLCNLGVALRDLGQAGEAIACYRQALRINPLHVQTHNNLGNALKDQGETAEAGACFRQALRLDPHYANAHYNLGILLKDQGELAEAVASFRQALADNPRHTDARNNLGVSLMYLGRLAEARGHYEEVLRGQPGNSMALWNRALLRLLEGDLAGGWPDYEQRWTQPGFVARHQDRPPWDGSALAGKTILLHAEQGLGDTIQFLRYASLVKQRGGTVLFECQPALLRLCTGMSGVDHLFRAGAAPPSFDVQAPLLSLPGVLGTTPATIPATVPYLRADPGLVAHWKKELTPVDGFKIGIAWQGSLTYAADRYRSFPLRHFESLAAVRGVRLVSLQKGPGAEQLQGQFPVLDLGEQFDVAGAFLDTSAIMMNLDLVITVDSAVAHLAGALAVPVWVALSSAPDWRWLLERADSPWYPTMRLFRQQRLGEWHGVFERMAAELMAKVLG